MRTRWGIAVVSLGTAVFGFVACVSDDNATAPVIEVSNEGGTDDASVASDAGGAVDSGGGNVADAPSDAGVDGTPPPPTGNLLFGSVYGAGSGAQSLAMAVDQSGNTFLAFQFNTTVQIDATHSVTPGPIDGGGSNSDIALVKLDKTGAVAWVKTWDSGAFDNVRALAADTDVYLSGDIGSLANNAPAIDFGNGAKVTNLGGQDDPFVVKLSGVDGSGIWADNLATPGASNGSCTDVVVRGPHLAVACTGFSSPMVIPLKAGGSQSVSLIGSFPAGPIVASMEAATGKAYWATAVGSDVNSTFLTGMAVDKDGAVVLGINSRGAAVHSTDNTTNITNPRGSGQPTMFVTKLQGADGVGVWGKAFADSNMDAAAPEANGGGIAINSAGDVIVGGQLTGTVPIGTKTIAATGTTGPDSFIAKLHGPDGLTMWAVPFGKDLDERQAFIALDAFDNIFAIGRYQSSNLTFGASPALPAPWTTTFRNPSYAGPFGMYVAKFTTDGNAIWGYGQIGVDPLGYGGDGGSDGGWTSIGPGGGDPSSVFGDNIDSKAIAVDSTGAVTVIGVVGSSGSGAARSVTLSIDGGSTLTATPAKSIVLQRRAP